MTKIPERCYCGDPWCKRCFPNWGKFDEDEDIPDADIPLFPVGDRVWVDGKLGTVTEAKRLGMYLVELDEGGDVEVSWEEMGRAEGSV